MSARKKNKGINKKNNDLSSTTFQDVCSEKKKIYNDDIVLFAYCPTLFI